MTPTYQPQHVLQGQPEEMKHKSYKGMKQLKGEPCIRRLFRIFVGEIFGDKFKLPRALMPSSRTSEASGRIPATPDADGRVSPPASESGIPLPQFRPDSQPGPITQ